jgi:FixJ family two-component response regulator
MKRFFDSRIIVLDDDPRVLENLSEVGGHLRLRSDSFASPAAALEFATENGCEIVMLNISQKYYSPDLISQFGKNLKVIVTTESKDKGIAIQALKFGAFDFLEKPLDNELLNHSILRALRTLANQRQLQQLMDDLEQSRSELASRQRRLETLNAQLFETNKALSVLARNIEREREEMESQIALRLRNLMMPIVTRLKGDQALGKYESELNMLTWHLEDLTSKFSIDPDVAMTLSAAELRVASLVKNGVSSEEIARQLHISENTVRTHRRSIRKKLKINGQHSLRNFLDSRGAPRRRDRSGEQPHGLN